MPSLIIAAPFGTGGRICDPLTGDCRTTIDRPSEPDLEEHPNKPPAQPAPAPQPAPQPNPREEPGNKPPVFPPHPRLPAPCNKNFFSNFNRQRPRPTPRLLDATLFRFFR